MRPIKNEIFKRYREIKSDVKYIFKNPVNLFLLPVFILIYIKNRWSSQHEFVYLIETKIEGHPLLSKKKESKYQAKRINDYYTAIEIIKQREIQEVGYNYNNDEIKNRFERGDFMEVLYVNKTPASYLFISEKSAYFQQVKCFQKLDKGCFAIYDVYTFIDYRSKGLYETLLSEVLFQMQKKYDKFWLWVMQHNQNSVKVHDRLHINQIIRVYEEYFRFGFRRFKVNHVNLLLSELIKK